VAESSVPYTRQAPPPVLATRPPPGAPLEKPSFILSSLTAKQPCHVRQHGVELNQLFEIARTLKKNSSLG